jgi:hypothetical protein
LQNRTNETLNFQTREPNSGSWRNQSAYPHESKTFRFSPGVMHGRMRISTRDRGFVEYDIRAGWGYSLVWDKHKHVWDFRTVHRSN